MHKGSVECEFQREGRDVIVSAREGTNNFTLRLPIEGAIVFATSAQRVVEDDPPDDCLRFSVRNAGLEVSK